MADARLRPIINAFTSGELSPEFDGRTDHKKYYNGVRTGENGIVRPVGGFRRRPGLRFVRPAISNATRSVLFDYTPRAGVSYVLEFGEEGGVGKLRFFRNNGQILADTELATNGSFDTSLTNWTASGGAVWLSGLASLPLATSQITRSIAVSASVAHAFRFRISGATLVQVRVSSVASPGSDLLNAVLGAGTYTYTLTSPTAVMALTFIGPGEVDDVSLKPLGSPYEVVTPYLAGDLPNLRLASSADVIYLACEGYAPRKLSRLGDTSWTLNLVTFRPPPTEEKNTILAADLSLGASSGTGITATASVGVFLAGDVDRIISSGAGRAVIVGFTSATVVTVDILDNFGGQSFPSGTWVLQGSPAATLTPNKKEPKGAQVTLTAGANAFRSADVGKYVKIHNGLVRITDGVSATVVKGEIVHVLDATTGTTNWTLESDTWNATDGWPQDLGFSSGDRLVYLRNDRVWGSAVGDYETFTVTTLDDDAFEFRLRTSEVCLARWLVGATDLLIGTTAAEFVLTGGAENPITPTNVKQQSDTTYGAARGRALRVGGAVLFVEQSARGLREFVFDITVNRYVAPDLLQLAQHLVPQGLSITSMAYQRSPDSILWAVRSDGALLAMTYNRPEEVVAWARQITDGVVESVAVIPHPDSDREQTWVSVFRDNGRYIEFFDDSSLFTDVNGVSYGQAGLDSCLLHNGTPLSVVAGLGHLEGQTVQAIADGVKVNQTFTVTGGQITLPAAASKIEVGLPYTTTLVPMRPEVQLQGSSQGVAKTHGPVTVRVYKTIGVKVNEDTISLESPLALFSGDLTVDNVGWDEDGLITVVQDQPYPCEVLMITSVMGVGS